MKKVNKKEIIKYLNENALCVLPTDTVYGLMAKCSKENEERLNILKKRDKDQKISIIFPTINELLENTIDLNEEKINMIKDKLPGKYTFIVNLKKEFCDKYNFKRQDFGVRVTSNKTLQNILKKTGPVLATSCNYSKEDICISYKDIKRIFLDKDIYVYYKKKGTNKSSSIIQLNSKEITVIR